MEWLDSVETSVTMDNVSSAEDCVVLCHGPNGEYANCVVALFVPENDGICTAYYGQNLLIASQTGVLTADVGSSVITASALLLSNSKCLGNNPKVQNEAQSARAESTSEVVLALALENVTQTQQLRP